jgi:hypothetical protein
VGVRVNVRVVVMVGVDVDGSVSVYVGVYVAVKIEVAMDVLVNMGEVTDGTVTVMLAWNPVERLQAQTSINNRKKKDVLRFILLAFGILKIGPWNL